MAGTVAPLSATPQHLPQRVQNRLMPLSALFLGLVAAMLHLLYFNSLLMGHQVAALTAVYPLARGSGPLVTAVAAVVLLGEPLSARAWG